MYGRVKVKDEADLIHCYVNSIEENHKEPIENMRLYVILLSTLPIYMCFILGLFLQNAKTGYPSNCHMLLSLFLRYRAAYKRIILCTSIRISQHHREFRTSRASMCMYFLKVLGKHIKERVLFVFCKLIFFMVYVQIKNRE